MIILGNINIALISRDGVIVLVNINIIILSRDWCDNIIEFYKLWKYLKAL